MINESKGRKKEILFRLRELNKEAYIILHSFHFKMSKKYKVLQKQDCWKEAKKLLLEYFTYDNILVCPECGKVIDARRCVVHHKSYKIDEMMSPCFISIVHYKCHEKIHNIN